MPDLMAHFAATDWGEFHARIPEEIHRGLYAPESHGVLAAPMSDEDVAHGLIAAHQEEHFPYQRNQRELFGTHWTSDEGVARDFAQEHKRAHFEDDDQCPDHDEHFEATPVVFHARRPQRHEIEDDPRRLGWQNVDDYTDPEHEVPIRHGAPVHITGVSWLKHTGLGPMWHRHDLRKPVELRAEDRDSPSNPNEWNASLHTAAWHEGPHYHGTPAELAPGDLIEPNKYPPTMPDPDIRGERAGEPRQHVYFAPRKDYVTEHYGPNVYEVEPTGDYKHDPEYGWQGGSRYMYRSKEPLRVKRKVSKEWGLPHEGLLAHFAAAAGEGFPNPYHGTMPGGRPEFSHTWFHGTKQAGPQMSQGRPLEKRYSEHESWPQPNKLLGTHFSPLHSVAHGFAFPMHGSRWADPPEPGRPSALVHARLRFRDPAHFPSEDHLNLAVAQWASKHHPLWHNDKLNNFLAGSYQNTEGTHRDWFEHEPGGTQVNHGLPDAELAQHVFAQESSEGRNKFLNLAHQAQHVMSWHPHLPEILRGFTDHLHEQGHHGITYGNNVEGPMGSVSAIATHPSQIETTHVEHIAAPDREPEPHEVRYSREGDVNHTPGEEGAPAGQRASSDLNEPEDFNDKIERLHTGQGKGDAKTYPRQIRLHPGYREHREAAFSWLKSEFEEEPEEPDEREITKDTDWSQGWPGFPHQKRKKTAAAPAYDGPWYHGSAHRFKAGDLIEPGYHKAHDVSSKEHVYLAASESVARTFGGLAAVRNKAKTYGIYQVEPTGPTEPDPDGMGHRTQHPLRVVRLHERGSSPGDPNPWWNQPGTGKGYPKQAAVPGRAFDAEAEPGPFEPGTHPGPFLHGGPTRVEPGDVIRNDARPVEWGRLQHNFFTTSRQVAEDAADMRNGRGHGWIHTVEPTDSYERDYGEPDSFRSRAPLRVLSVEPGRLNGSTPHPPIVKAGSHGDDFTEASGYVGCDQGHEHWGPHGASFLLLRHHDPADDTKRYLLQKRTSTGATDHGGTWALPGGALQHEGEDSYAAARREAREEMGPLPRMKHHHTVRDDHGGWFADTHVADVQHRFQPHGEAKTGFEAEGHAWFTHDEIAGLKDKGALHPGFAKSWDTVRRSRVDKEAVWDTSGSDKTGLYVRFGHWPRNERSFSSAGGYHEDGVSAYDMDKHGNPAIDHGLDRGHVHDEHCEEDCDLDIEGPDNDPKQEMQGRIAKAERNRYYGEDEPSETAHLVRGTMAAIGYDGEPLLRDVRRVGDWIDHKHLFFPGTKPHKLARDEHDEDYEPPEEAPPHTAVLHPDPPDWAHGMQSGGSQVEWVRREKLQKYMEFHHDRETGQSHYLPTGHRFPDRYSKERWDEMDSSVAEHGMHEPILLEYNPWTRKMHIGEGHHRLESAARAGHEMVPVWGLKTSQEHPHAKPVPGEPKVRPEHFEGGYFPSSFKPSDVLPEHWMKSRAEREQDEWLHPKNAARGEEPPERYYHGTNAELSPGDQVTTGHPATFGRSRQPMSHVYTTKSIGAARAYATSRSRLHGGEPHVYEVRPAPDVEPDPEGKSAGPHPYRASSLTVHRELSLDELRGNGKTAVITPGSLPPGQQAAFDAEDHREHRRRMFDVAKHPEPGTRVWRGEIRRNDEDPASVTSTGMHWSASPDPIITGWAPEGHKHVVWQGIVEHHDEQAFPRGHPIWSGRHMSFDHEAEVRFRPGAHVRLEGAYVHEPKEYPGGMATTPGHLVPRFPERTHPDWKWHPLDRHIEIRHAGHGASDYSELGIPRETSADPAMVP